MKIGAKNFMFEDIKWNEKIWLWYLRNISSTQNGERANLLDTLVAFICMPIKVLQHKIKNAGYNHWDDVWEIYGQRVSASFLRHLFFGMKKGTLFRIIERDGVMDFEIVREE